MRMKKSQFIILIYLLISVTFEYVLSIGNDQPKENKLFRSPTYGKASSILRDILKQESSLRFSMVQKVQNLVTDAIENNNITEILRKKLVYLGNKVNSMQSENRRLEEALDEFREDQNATNIQLQNVPSVPHLSNHCFFPFDCFDVYNCGERRTGVYYIYPFTTRVSIQVLCNMDTDGGGWTVIQHRNRENPRVNFNTTWDEYKRGFGDANKNFWLGNDAIHELTISYNNSLFIRLENTDNKCFEVRYSSFSISAESDGYRLYLGNMTGNIGIDAFRKHMLINKQFSTYDHDNIYTCAAKCGSGWWYDRCTHVLLNAPFFEQHNDRVWYGTISQGKDLLLSEMLIRRT